MFQKTIIDKYLKLHIQINKEKLDELFSKFVSYFLDAKVQDNIRTIKEEQFQEGFLRELFVNTLGYTIQPSPNYNLVPEKKNKQDSQKADGAILVGGAVAAVIELKSLKTPNLKDIDTQAFNYKAGHVNCRYVITSNFEKLRFYIDNKTECEEFNLFSLTKAEFVRLHLLISYDSISVDLPQRIKEESLSEEESITNKLYKDYSEFKRALFSDIVAHNPTYSKLLLFKKTQKLLDRLLFIFFAEDKLLLPSNTILGHIQNWERLMRDPLNPRQRLYDRFKGYFHLLNIGSREHGVYAYNGGLFAFDEVLDNITISDDILASHTEQISKYDFDTEVDVNILGHIFENSLSEIEEVTEEIVSGTKRVSRRKKDGVFYTPRYITTYIVENTIGRLCLEKRAEFEINEEDYVVDQSRKKPALKKLVSKLNAYRNWLLSLTICDPACGSGAFLNAALDFLISEHGQIDEMSANIHGVSMVIPDIETSILENNLFGVDINEESVEIAKLSLWLRTAKPQRKLNSLSNNIKCGNSLISDPSIAGEKAFDWQTEFSQIFANGGFDVVIGNPPYGAKLSKTHTKYFAKYYSNWGISDSLNDTYFIFYVLSLRDILSHNGILGFITPNTWKSIESAKCFRTTLLNNINILQIIQHTNKVFIDATVDCDTLIVKKQSSDSDICIRFMREDQITREHYISAERLRGQDYINLFLTEHDYLLIEKIKGQSVRVKDILLIKNGIKPYEKGKGKPAQTDIIMRDKPFTSKVRIDSTFSPLVGGSLFNRYILLWDNNYWIQYGEWLAAPRDPIIFSMPEKLIFRQTSDKIIGTYITDGFIMRNNTHIVLPKLDNTLNLKSVLVMLNSKLSNYYYWTINPEKGEAMAEVKAFHLGLLPIKEISKIEEKSFIEQAEIMLELNNNLYSKNKKFQRRLNDNFDGLKMTGALERCDDGEFKGLLAQLKKQKFSLSLKQQDEWEGYFDNYKAECNTMRSQIAATDNKIDQMVYELYALTSEEIKIIEA